MIIRSPIGVSFADHLEAFADDKQPVHSDVLFQIFYDLYKIRQALIKYKQAVRRRNIWTTADIFQDLIAKYLRINLPDYEVSLEYVEKNKKRPDIMIKKEGKNYAIIEAKTTVGWKRDFVRKGKFKERLLELSEAYSVPSERVFYVFESSTNVGKDFERMFSDEGNRDVKEAIIPLFKKQVLYGPDMDYSDEQIKKLYDEVVCVPKSFDKILEKVK